MNAMSVRLRATNTYPAHVNPDFLRFNEIVPGEWVVERPVVLETGYSRVDYDNGFSVTATGQYVHFYQRNLLDPTVELTAVDVAARYFECSPRYLSVDSVMIAPDCLLLHADGIDAPFDSPISGLAIPFGDIIPHLFVRAAYRLGDKGIDVTLSDGVHTARGGVQHFRVGGFITFNLPVRNSPGDTETVQAALAASPTAVEQFYEIAQHLCTQYLGLEVGS